MRFDRVCFAQAADITPDPWQEKLLQSAALQILINCSRQAGKSLTSAIIAIHTAIYEDNSPILLLSPSLRQSQELFRACLDVYKALGRAEPPEAETALRLELSNGSRIISLPGKETNIRGFSKVKLLIIDEASRVPDSLYQSVRPMLAVSGGRMIAPSTPAGQRGWWHDAWTNGGNAWERYQVRADQVPRISPAFLAEERRSMGPNWYAQEYECAFTGDVNSVFPEHYLQGMFTDDEHAWSVPPADWAKQKESVQSWSNHIKIKPKDPRMTPYGIPYL